MMVSDGLWISVFGHCALFPVVSLCPEVASCARCGVDGVAAKCNEFWVRVGPSAAMWQELRAGCMALHDSWDRLQRHAACSDAVGAAVCIMRSRGLLRYNDLMKHVLSYSGIHCASLFDADDIGQAGWFRNLSRYWLETWRPWVESLERDRGEVRVNLRLCETLLPTPVILGGNIIGKVSLKSSYQLFENI